MTDIDCQFHTAGFEQTFDIQNYLVQNQSATYFFRVGSDAMSGAGIAHGDRLVVDRTIKPKNRDIVIAVHQGQFLVRRLHLLQDRIELFAENPHFPLIQFTTEQDLDIWGTVIGLVRKY